MSDETPRARSVAELHAEIERLGAIARVASRKHEEAAGALESLVDVLHEVSEVPRLRGGANDGGRVIDRLQQHARMARVAEGARAALVELGHADGNLIERIASLAAERDDALRERDDVRAAGSAVLEAISGMTLTPARAEAIRALADAVCGGAS